MKKCLLLFLISTCLFANPHIEEQLGAFERFNAKFTELKCPVKLEMNSKSFSLESSHHRSKTIATLVGEIEYPLRLKCQSLGEGFSKFSSVEFVAGKTNADYSKCSDEQIKDAVSVKLNGKKVTVTCKYANCACAGNEGKKQFEALLK
jgi:hypothetical protein